MAASISLMTLASGGYWGAPTATIDWCEANYAHSQYVSEWYNTLSSLAMVAVGVLGVVLHRKLFERRLLLAFASVALVGVGSIAFHGTLLFQLQMLDELPMLYTATLLVYILLEDRATRRYGLWLPTALMAYLAAASYGDAFTRGDLQFFLFQVTFATLEFYCLWRTYRLYQKSASQPLRRLFRFGMLCYASAIALWFVDLRFCGGFVRGLAAFGLPNPQLHAWWHVLVSLGFYCLILVIGHERLRALGDKPRLMQFAGLGLRVHRDP